MKRIPICSFVVAAVMCAAGGQSSQRVERPAPPARIGTETCEQFAERMRWFVDARFGMFIHFGLYSLPAWHEWIKTRRVVPEEAYQRYFDNFNPDLFDAREWVRKAKSAGMRYIVLTAKHHEGFCLWDTKFTDYKITNTPFGRDLVRELVDGQDHFPVALAVVIKYPDSFRGGAHDHVILINRTRFDHQIPRTGPQSQSGQHQHDEIFFHKGLLSFKNS